MKALSPWTLAQRIAYRTGPPVPPTNCRLWQGHVNRDGYGRVRTDDKIVYVARAVLEIKLGRPVRPGLDACHKPTCISRACIEPSHLREDSRKGNIADAVALGRMNGAPGASNANAKLNPQAVRDIRKQLRSGASYAELGRQYGVTYGTISRIDKGETWTSVK